jgi:hypothetical protein
MDYAKEQTKSNFLRAMGKLVLNMIRNYNFL